MDINTIKKNYQENGTVLIDLRDSFLSNEDFSFLEEASKNVPYENVTIGDAGEKNQVDVARFMTDVDAPTEVESKYTKKVLEILNSKTHLDSYKKILNFEGDLFIRRVQINKMKKNSFIGHHLDSDSNPDYIAAVVTQLGNNFSGGDFLVHKKDKINTFKPFYKSMCISNCNLPHEVTKIESGERISLVFFLCSHNEKNRRYHKKD